MASDAPRMLPPHARAHHGQRQQRNDRGSDGDAGKTVATIDQGTERCTGGIGGVHRNSDPRHYFAGISRADQAKAPAQRPRDDQALATAEQDAADQEHAERGHRRRRESQRCEIGHAEDRRDHKADHHGALGAADIGEAAGPCPRQQRRGEWPRCNFVVARIS
jgi:hypothetical protein